MPLFNKFSPLDDPALAARVEALLAPLRLPLARPVRDGRLEALGHGNAYFTGFGAAKRIVLFDTLVSRLQPAEVEAVLAHELGHYKLHHVVKRDGARLAAFSFALLFVLGLLAGQPWFYRGWACAPPRCRGRAAALHAGGAGSSPSSCSRCSSLFSRKHEYEADAYAAQHAKPAELVQALVKLYQDNAATLTPDPLHSAFYDSHPPAAMRIARLRTT